MSAKRRSWDQYFIAIAREAATRATCDRRHVGAVIVYDRQILATGYNGSVKGTEHCDDVGHLIVDGHCVRTIHAELNAILQAALRGTAIDGSTLYCTTFPCMRCFQAMINAGITEVCYADEYQDLDDALGYIRGLQKTTGTLIRHIEG